MHEAVCKILGSLISINNVFIRQDWRAGQLTVLSGQLSGTTVSPTLMTAAPVWRLIHSQWRYTSGDGRQCPKLKAGSDQVCLEQRKSHFPLPSSLASYLNSLCCGLRKRHRQQTAPGCAAQEREQGNSESLMAAPAHRHVGSCREQDSFYYPFSR